MRKKMTENEAVLKAIEDWMFDNKCSSIPRHEAMAIVETHKTMPSKRDLQIQWLSNQVSSIMSRLKDENKTRTHLSNGNGGFTDIENERDIKDINGVIEQLTKREAGIIKTKRKVEHTKWQIENGEFNQEQIDIEEVN